MKGATSRSKKQISMYDTIFIKTETVVKQLKIIRFVHWLIQNI